MDNNAFDNILKHQDLGGIIRWDCSESDGSIEFDSSLERENGDLNEEIILILKPDAFYYSKRMHNPPPSPDYLILVFCSNKVDYNLYLVELKKFKCPYEEISKKFQTMIDKFFVEFNGIFGKLNYSMIKFCVVTSYPKKIKGAVLDAYSSRKTLKLYNKAILIQPLSALTIMPC